MSHRLGLLATLVGFGHGDRGPRLEDAAAEQIREAAAGAAVVYVLPRPSWLDLLALNAVLITHRLPLSCWTPGVGTWAFPPIGLALRALWDRLRARWQHGAARPPPGWVEDALRKGHAITLFSTPSEGPHPFAPVLAAAAGTEIHLVPIEVVWDRRPETSGLARLFLSGHRAPYTLRKLGRQWRGVDTFVQVGQPMDVGTVRGRVHADRGSEVLRRLSIAALARESKLVRGPQLLPHRDMKVRVLRTPAVRTFAQEEAQERGVGVSTVDREISRAYDQIAARFSWTIISALHLLLRPLWTRVFSGVDVPEADLERIRQAMRDGTPILIPSHKSHFDYLLLSWVMYDNNLVLPHVVAGLNLAVWPISIILRGAGGFFIKRSFAGQRVFPMVFERYLRELMRQEYPVEFFIEGGRTRSGKLMVPRTGVLNMVLEAATTRASSREVTLLPMAFAYEQVAEEGSYARELGGERKRPETIAQLLRARSVLSRRFGRAYLRVGAPLQCTDDFTGDGDRVGRAIVHRIGQVVVLLPTALVAMALLAHHTRAITHVDLVARIGRLDALMHRLDVQRAASLTRFEPAIAQALQRFADAGHIEAVQHGDDRVWDVSPDARLSLDFHKNQILHLLAPAGLAAAALRAWSGPPPAPSDLLPAFRALLHVWHREFILDPDRAPEALLADGLDLLASHQAIPTAAGPLTPRPDRIGEVFAMFSPLLESYTLVLRHGARPATTRDALARALQEDGDAGRLPDRISRPEALSLVTLKNAIARFTDLGVFQVDTRGRLTLDSAAAREHLDILAPMVDP